MALSRAVLAVISLLVVGSAAQPGNVNGVISGAGYYVGCSVKVELPSGYTPTAITQVPKGTFSIPCTFKDGSSCVGSVLEMGSDQGEGCRDTVTGLPVMFGLKAPLVEPVVAGGSVAVTPVTTLQAVLYDATNRGDWSQLAALVEEQLGLPNIAAAYKAGGYIAGAYNGDVIEGASEGLSVSLSFHAAGAQLHNLVTVGASLLGGMLIEDDGPLTPDAVSEAVYYALGLQMALAARRGSTIDLVNATTIATTLSAAKASLQKLVDEDKAAAAAAKGPAAAPASAGSRRMLREANLLDEDEEDLGNSTTVSAKGIYDDEVETISVDAYNTTAAQEEEEEEGGAVGAQSISPQPQGSPLVAAGPSPQPESSPVTAAAPSPQPEQPESPEPEKPSEPEDSEGDGDLEMDMPDLTAFGKMGVVAAPIAIINELVAASLAEGLKTGAQPAVVMNVLARIMAVAQMDIAATARQLGEGYVDAGEFQAYDMEGLIRLIQSVPLA